MVKCTATMVIVQKAYETTGLLEEELKQRVNDQCRDVGKAPAFELLVQEISHVESPKFEGRTKEVESMSKFRAIE